MPPKPHRRLGGAIPAQPNPLLDPAAQTAPVSELRDVKWSSPTEQQPVRLEPKHPDAEPGSPAAVTNGNTGKAPISRFCHRPDNPRYSREYDASRSDEMRALGDTIGEYGVLQPLTVVAAEVWLASHPTHELPEGVWWVVLIGNRRFAGAKAQGLAELAFVRNDSLAEPQRAMESSLIENRHRADLDPIHEALTMAALMEDYRLTQRGLAKRINFTNGHISQRLHLLNLIGPFRDLVSARRISADKARPIASLSGDEQKALLELGEPYNPARLRESDASSVDDAVVTREAVRIAPRSSATDIVLALTRGLSGPLIQEVTRMLAAQGSR